MDVHGQKFMDKSMANPRKFQEFGPNFLILQICLHPTVFVVGKKPSWRSISNFPVELLYGKFGYKKSGHHGIFDLGGFETGPYLD